MGKLKEAENRMEKLMKKDWPYNGSGGSEKLKKEFPELADKFADSLNAMMDITEEITKAKEKKDASSR